MLKLLSFEPQGAKRIYFGGKLNTEIKIFILWEVYMKSVTVNLTLAENVKKFVAIAEKYPFDIDLRSGRHVVNAKSMLGIFSLDLSDPCVVEIFTDDCKKFLDEINDFIA